MTKTEFADEVNRLAQAEADRINQSKPMFGAVHHRFPQSMLDWYYDNEFTPQQTIQNINQNAGL